MYSSTSHLWVYPFSQEFHKLAISFPIDRAKGSEYLSAELLNITMISKLRLFNIQPSEFKCYDNHLMLEGSGSGLRIEGLLVQNSLAIEPLCCVFEQNFFIHCLVLDQPKKTGN